METFTPGEEMVVRNRKRRIWPCAALGIVLVLVLLIGNCSPPVQRERTPIQEQATAGREAGPAAGTTVEEIVSGGQTRRFLLHIPPGYQAGQPLALVLNFHGLNSNAAEQERVSRMSVLADEAGFIVAYPEGLGDPQTWRVGPREEAAADQQFVRDLVAHLQASWSVDPARIYATGISNGAQMSNRLGCEAADLLAAIGPVSSGYPPTLACNPARPVPVIAFHGTADKLIPYEGQGRLLQPAREWAAGWAARNGCDPNPTITFQQGEVTGETWSGCRDNADVVFYTVEGGGHSWPGSDMAASLDITTQDIDATDATWAFFVAHPRP